MEITNENIVWATEIENELKALYPECRINANYSENLTKNISIYFTVGKDKSEYANGIYNNDPLLHNIIIFIENNHLELNFNVSHLTIKPKNKFFAQEHVKLGRNIKNGTKEQIHKAIINHFKVKLPKTVAENVDNLFDWDKEMIVKKILKK